MVLEDFNNQPKRFNFEGKNIRAVKIDGNPYFVAKDVAKAIGYTSKSSINRAMTSHVALEHKGVRKMRTPGGMQEMIVISEPGVYELAAKSKLPSAYPFQKWVFEEVLPSINHTGEYKSAKAPKPMTATSQLRLATKSIIEIDDRVSKLESNQTINPGEYGYLNSLVGKQVYSYANNVLVHYNRKQIKELYKDISNGIKQVSNIKTRSQLRAGQYNSVIDYVTSWVPSTATKQVVKSIQLDLGDEDDD